MPIKHWILSRIHHVNGIVGRPDLARPRSSRTADGAREPSLGALPQARDAAAPGPAHLGVYAPLIAAIRDELSHFVTGPLRLHLAIAERDRFLLTSIDVECIDGGDGSELLRRFTDEFTPEQVKRFLARDVIGHLPNAAAIDLSQFGGLNATGDGGDDTGPYAELVAQLSAATPGDGPRAFDVSLVGRWTDSEREPPSRSVAAAPPTPLAGQRIEIEIEDADGVRHVSLASVVANRRYVIGKGDACDIVVNGAFTSRRHCELWLDGGRWWAADAGSTNGMRVESARSVLGRSGARQGTTTSVAAIEIPPDARIVLSAAGQGTPAEYPRVLLRQALVATAASTPIGPGAVAPTTPVTPLATMRARAAGLVVDVAMASGSRMVPLPAPGRTLSVGRSRSRDLVVDWAHEGVSGHHVDITGVDETGADVLVHGDNGVNVAGTTHASGQRFRWRVGETMTLGRASGDEPECRLTLAGRP